MVLALQMKGMSVTERQTAWACNLRLCNKDTFCCMLFCATWHHYCFCYSTFAFATATTTILD